MKTIQQSTASVEDTRRKMLLELLKERYRHDDVSEAYIAQEVDYYMEQLEEGKPILALRPQEKGTDAIKYNQEMREFEIDIHTLFDHLNHVGYRINQHQKLNESILNDVQIRIHKVDEKIEELGYLLRSNVAHAVAYETFIDYKSKDWNQHLYTDQKGKVVPPSNHLVIDTYQHSLKLPAILTENKLVNFAGVKLANIRVNKQIGGGFVRTKNPEHTIEKAIDTSLETYWNESLLVDEPLEVNLGLDYYGLNFGATCEVEVIFDYASKLNEITFTPFTEYPLEVVAILVYDTDDTSKKPYELVSPTATIQNRESVSVMSFQFQDIVAKRVIFILNQQHYTKKDVILNLDDKTIIDAWLKTQDHVEIEESRIFKPIEQNQREMYPFWGYLQAYMKDKNILDEINRYQDVDFSNTIHVSKYEYQYGLYNIAMNHNEYFHEGVFVTVPLANTNVHIVQLETNEEHPILEELKVPITDIEYYVTDTLEPAQEDWVSILPIGTKRIWSERLHPVYQDGKYVAPTRFDISRIYNVRASGERLRSQIDWKSSGRSIIVENYNPSKLYTIDYKPHTTAYAVDFLSRYTARRFEPEENRMVEEVRTKTYIEEFQNVETGNQLSLSYYPFVDKNKLNVIESNEEDWNPTYLSNSYFPFKVRLILPDGYYVDQKIDKYDNDGIFITNRTDYYDMNRSLLEPFSGTNYQYRVEKNKLKFNTALPKGTRIIVEYPYLTGPIRMKIIMRRNLHEVQGLTPFLHDYKMIFQSLV